MSSAWSSAASTASTVPGPISWPPSTSSASSSTTARAWTTFGSSPSIVRRLPRSCSVIRRRSRSASSTPSPTVASSAATSFETERTSCTEAQCRRCAGLRRSRGIHRFGTVSSPTRAPLRVTLALEGGGIGPHPGWGYELRGLRRRDRGHVALRVEGFELCEPWIARVYDPEASRQPLSLLPTQPGSRDVKVVLVLLQVVLRLVEQLDLRRDDRQRRRRSSPNVGRRSPDAGVAPAQPDAVLDVVQEELQLVAAGLPRLLRRRAPRRKGEDLMDRELQPVVPLPRIESTRPFALE